jgi:carbonic anhydrase/acetyltransferase-like protein (isoleucine patch superfamily)
VRETYEVKIPLATGFLRLKLGKVCTLAGSDALPAPRRLNMKDNLRFRPELVDPTVYIAPGAIVLGDVTLSAESSVWFNSVIRGDTDAIRIGRQSNVQDLAVIHCDEGVPCSIGDRVTLGHAAIVHGATIEDDCLIGIRAVVMNGARIGAGSLVAVGALVTEGVQIPPGSLVMGMPGKVVRQISEHDLERIRHAAAHYVTAGRNYRAAGIQR